MSVVREDIQIPAHAHALTIEIFFEDGRDGFVRVHGVGKPLVIDGSPDGATLHEGREAQNEEWLKIAFHTVSPVPDIPDAVSGFLLFTVFLGSDVWTRLVDFVFPADVGAHAAEFFLNALIAPVQVIDAAYLRGTLGGETGQNERGRSAQIGGHDRRAGQMIHSAYHGRMACDGNVGTHADKLGGMHEAVFKDALVHHAGSLREAHHGHDLGLHVRGKARVGLRGDVAGLYGTADGGLQPVTII